MSVVQVTAADLRAQQLEGRIGLMVEYLQMKVRERDWHGVADAAMDLRELEAALREVRA